MRHGFTLIELVFVIVILGILAAVAIPKMAATRDDAIIAKHLQYVGAVATEVPAYVLSRAEVKDDLSQMSNTLATLKESGLLSIDTATKSASLKVGEDQQCVTFRVVGDEKESNLTISVNSSSTDPLCRQLRGAMVDMSFNVKLRGSFVRM
jgi:general secretion pathway protein G